MLRAIKRWTILVHSYLGVALCALFFVWFVSGVVMMYQPYPELTLTEKIGAMPALDCRACRVGFGEALAKARVRESLGPIRLGMLLHRPVWRFMDDEGRWTAVFADDGVVVDATNVHTAADVASAFVGSTGTIADYRETLLDSDQWTLTGSVRRQMPLVRFDLRDGAGTRVYISPRSGEVLSASTRRERLVSWFGAVPHLLYPAVLRRRVTLWSNLVIWLSGIGTILGVTGVTIGLWQWRWRRQPASYGLPTPRAPYRDFILRWHHMLGTFFGVFVCTWVLSGLFSMNPGSWSPGLDATSAQRLRWTGGPVDPSRFLIAPDSAWRELVVAGWHPRELHATMFNGTPYWIGYETTDRVQHVRADSASHPSATFPRAQLLAVAADLVPGARVTAIRELSDYDAYYYDMSRQLPLPVYRLSYNDPRRTWLYLEPRSGAIAQRREWRSRLERWLYSGLHDLDFPWLANRRPLWDVVMIVLAIGGASVSLTGAVIGWRWVEAVRTGDRHLRRH